MEHRIFHTPVSSVYPHYLSKIERKGRTQAELDEVIRWLTGFDEATLRRQLKDRATFAEFFSDASLNSNASLITGVVCGVKVQEVDDPLMRKIRFLDKLVDELARVSLWRRSYAARSTSHSLPELRSPEAGRARCDYRQRRVVALPCAGFGLWLITKYG